MFSMKQWLNVWMLSLLIKSIDADWRSRAKVVTVESGSDLSLSCTFSNVHTDETIVQWLYQNLTDHFSRITKHHWRPLFLNTQSLTPKETRYSIQQKLHYVNDTAITYSTILTLNQVMYADEGLYMCKSLSPRPMQMTYQVQVIQSMEVNPKRLIIPTNEQSQYSIRLNCILKTNNTNRRHYDVLWRHNDRRLGSKTSRFARISKNLTDNSLISTLILTGKPMHLIGNFACEIEPLKKYISVELQTNQSTNSRFRIHRILFLLILTLSFHR